MNNKIDILTETVFYKLKHKISSLVKENKTISLGRLANMLPNIDCVTAIRDISNICPDALIINRTIEDLHSPQMAGHIAIDQRTGKRTGFASYLVINDSYPTHLGRYLIGKAMKNDNYFMSYYERFGDKWLKKIASTYLSLSQSDLKEKQLYSLTSDLSFSDFLKQLI